MIIISSPAYEVTCSVCQSVCEIVDRNYPQFAQSSGQLLAGNFYLLNSSVSSSEAENKSKSIIMRVDRLGKATKEAIGEIGCRRFESFLKYDAGWDGGSAKQLSLESVAMIEIFIANFKDFITEPSLFLTRKGNLKLGWEDATGGAIEVEFMPNSFQYYLENREEEGSTKISELNKLINKIRLIQNAATTV